MTAKHPVAELKIRESVFSPEMASRTSLFSKILTYKSADSHAGLRDSEVNRSAFDLNEDPGISIETQANEPPVIVVEGHVFHQLIPCSPDNQEPGSADEYLVDRFVSESGESDDGVSRSDMATVSEYKTYGHSSTTNSTNLRASPAKLRSGFTHESNNLKRKHGVPIITKEDSLQLYDLCKVCRDNLGDECILMCESIILLIIDCHLRIHATCLGLTEDLPCPAQFNEEKIRSSFFSLFTSLFKNYRNHMNWDMSPTRKKQDDIFQVNSTSDIFNQEKFLLEFDADTKPFIRQMLNSQAFSQFAVDRLERPATDYEVLFFDESIQLKLNRSKLRFKKIPTPFLNDTSFQVGSLISTLPPYMESLPVDVSKTKDPWCWLNSFEVPPRHIQPLLAESDLMIMQSHTKELVMRSQNYETMKSQEFSRWMKGKYEKIKGIGSKDRNHDIMSEKIKRY